MVMHRKSLLFIAAGAVLLIVLSSGTSHAQSAVSLKEAADRNLRRGEIQSAVQGYRQAIHLDPSYKEAHFNLAVAYYTCGRLAEAAVCLEALLALSPEDTEALYNLGCLKLYSGNWIEAEHCFQRAASCCKPSSFLKSLIQNSITFVHEVEQMNTPMRQALLGLFRQGVIPAFSDSSSPRP